MFSLERKEVPKVVLEKGNYPWDVFIHRYVFLFTFFFSPYSSFKCFLSSNYVIPYDNREG